MSVRARITGPVAVACVLVAGGIAWAQYNVAEDRPYRCGSEIMNGWTGLVDGVSDSDTAPGCFATDNSDDFPKAVTIDLQRPCTIQRVSVHNSTNGNTRGIVIYCSNDGVQYEKLREFIFPQDKALTLNHRFNDRPAQFVRVEFTNTWGGGLGGDNTIFCREVEVFGSPTGGTGVTAPMEQPVGDPIESTRDVRLLRRWAIDDDELLTIAVLGDSLGSCGEDTWPQAVAERLALTRPDEAEVSLTAMTEEGLEACASSGFTALTAEAEPDVILVTFGSDLESWNRERFRSGLTKLARRLLDETEALVVLVGPAVGDPERVDIGRRALAEMERIADTLSLPLIRTEAAFLQEGLTAEDVRNESGAVSRQAREILATQVLELLLQPEL